MSAAIILTLDPPHIARCALPDVAPLLLGLPARAAPQVVSRLHALCRHAQGLASRLAIAAALGETPDSAETRAAWVRLHAEAFRETGLRLTLDWPALIGEAPCTAQARALVALPQEPAAEALTRWLHSLLASGLPARLLAAAPPALAPMFESRLAALTDAPLQIAGLAAGAPLTAGKSPASGHGAATVPTARGALTHRVQVIEGNIAAYAIDAPTARRFGKQGDAAELIAAAQSPEALQWAMQAIDPCVEWAIAQEEPA